MGIRSFRIDFCKSALQPLVMNALQLNRHWYSQFSFGQLWPYFTSKRKHVRDVAESRYSLQLSHCMNTHALKKN